MKAVSYTHLAELVVTGFEFIDGLAQDSRGNIYFCEHRMRRIYKLDARSGQVTSKMCIRDRRYPL